MPDTHNITLPQRDHHHGYDWGDWGDTLVNRLIAGIAILGGHQQPAPSGRPNADLALVSAEREMISLRAKSAALIAEDHDADELHDPIWARVGELIELINATEAKTLIGAAVKLRHLSDPEIGMAIGDRPDDVVSIRQLTALVERLGIYDLTLTQQEDDDLVLSLFRQWIAVCDEADVLDAGATDDEREPYYQRRDEIEDEIMATLGGAVALAIKAYLLVRLSQDGGVWAPRLATLRLDKDECRDIDVGVLRNAAALVPEIGELAASIIHEDAELIDLDMEVTWARTVLAGKQPCWPGETQAKLAEALNRIAQAEAKTERGEAIKARHASR